MKTKEMRVFGGNYDGRHRRIVAATSMASAIRIAGLRREYSSVTTNAEEVELAMRDVGTVWQRSHGLGRHRWTRIE